MSEYKFIEKADIEKLKDKWYGSLYADAWPVLERLLKEREAYREVAASLYEHKFQSDPELQDEWDGKTKFGDEVDAECRRLLAEEKGEKES